MFVILLPHFPYEPKPAMPSRPDTSDYLSLFLNDVPAPARNKLVFVSVGSVTLSQAPRADGTYLRNTSVTIVAVTPLGFQLVWGGVDSQDGVFATVKMDGDRFVTVDMLLLPSSAPAATPFP